MVGRLAYKRTELLARKERQINVT